MVDPLTARPGISEIVMASPLTGLVPLIGFLAHLVAGKTQ